MAASVADDPKLASLWDTPQNLQPAAKVDAHSYRPASWRCANGQLGSFCIARGDRANECPLAHRHDAGR